MIRKATTTVVVALAVLAAYVSYIHMFVVTRLYGAESMATAVVVPLTIDGMIVASGMVVLAHAQTGRRVPVLTWFGLAFGIVATVGVNAAYGLQSGPAGAVLAAWPAVALVVSYEALIRLVRFEPPSEPASREPEPEPAPVREARETSEPAPVRRAEPVPTERFAAEPPNQGTNGHRAGANGGPGKPAQAHPGNGHDDHRGEALEVYRAAFARGEPMSERALASRFGRGRTWARGVIAEAARPADGDAATAPDSNGGEAGAGSRTEAQTGGERR